MGEAEDRFIHNHGGYPEAPHSKPYKSKRFLDAEESSVCIESNFASLGRLPNTLCHVQGALAAWCDPARSSDDSSNPSSPQAVTDLYNLSNHLTAHIARLTFKAKNEVVMDRCRRFFKAFKSDISAFNVQLNESNAKRNIIPSSAGDALTYSAPLNGQLHTFVVRFWANRVGFILNLEKSDLASAQFLARSSEEYGVPD